MRKPPKQLARKTLYESDWIRLCHDRVEMPSGRIIEEYHILDYPFESVVVLVENDVGEICFIKSLRYTSQKIEWEIPAGGIDKGEEILAAAAREVREETGLVLLDAKEIYAFNPSNGMSTETLHVIHGKAIPDEQASFDTDEVLSINWLKIEAIQDLIDNKEIADGKSLLPLLLWLNSKHNE